jgi:hypothetical protein
MAKVTISQRSRMAYRPSTLLSAAAAVTVWFPMFVVCTLCMSMCVTAQMQQNVHGSFRQLSLHTSRHESDQTILIVDTNTHSGSTQESDNDHDSDSVTELDSPVAIACTSQHGDEGIDSDDTMYFFTQVENDQHQQTAHWQDIILTPAQLLQRLPQTSPHIR